MNAGTGKFVVNSTANVEDWEQRGRGHRQQRRHAQQRAADPVSFGGGIVTVMPGGQISPAADGSGESLDLDGSLLVNNGTLAGSTNVYYGSMAQGSGVYGPVHVYTGGTFKPGNSPGTVLLSGNLILDQGAASRSTSRASTAAVRS